MCQPIKVVGTMCRPQSSRHIPCAVHLEISQKLDCERHGGACLHLLSAVSIKTTSIFFVTGITVINRYTVASMGRRRFNNKFDRWYNIRRVTI